MTENNRRRGELVVLGAGGHGKVVADAAMAAGYRVVGFLDDDRGKWGRRIIGVPVLGGTDIDALSRFSGLYGVAAVGDNVVRARLYYRLVEAGLEPATIIHPYSYVSPHTRIGRGTVVLAGAVVQPGTVIGDNVIINTGASVDHDNTVMHHACINPQATLAGGVTVEYYATIHTNAAVAPYTRVAENTVVGAGAVVLHDTEPGKIYVGVPARILKDNPQEIPRELREKLYMEKYHTIIFETGKQPGGGIDKP